MVLQILAQATVKGGVSPDCGGACRWNRCEWWANVRSTLSPKGLQGIGCQCEAARECGVLVPAGPSASRLISLCLVFHTTRLEEVPREASVHRQEDAGPRSSGAGVTGRSGGGGKIGIVKGVAVN